MLNLPDPHAFSPRSPKILPLNSTSSWNAQKSDESNSYQYRQLQKIQANGPLLEAPPLHLGDLTPNEEKQVKRLQRLVSERPPIPSFTRPRSQRSRPVAQVSPSRPISPRRSAASSQSLPERPPRKRIVRRPRRRLRKRPVHPGFRLFLELMARYGWVVCCGTWVILVISGGFAGKALINPEHVTTYSASYDSPASKLTENQNREMLLFLGGIALGGTGASFILSKLLKTDR